MEIKVKKEYVLKKVGDQIIVVPIGKEAVRFHGMLTLNHTSEFLFNQLKEPMTLEALANKVVEKYEGVTFDIALKDVKQFVGILAENGLLE